MDCYLEGDRQCRLSSPRVPPAATRPLPCGGTSEDGAQAEPKKKGAASPRCSPAPAGIRKPPTAARGRSEPALLGSRSRSGGSLGDEKARPMEPRLTRGLLSKLNLEEAETNNAGHFKDLQQAVFKDQRWENALQFLRHRMGADEAEVQKLLRRGAREFGFWHLADDALQALVDQLMGREAAASPALGAWLHKVEHEECPLKESKFLSTRLLVAGSGVRALSDGKGKEGRQTGAGRESRQAKIGLLLVVFLVQNGYALHVVLDMYPGIFHLFGPPIYVARMCGMGTLLWTAMLFIFMSRSWFKYLDWRLPRAAWFHRLVEQHKELHIFCGKMLMVNAVVHTVAHCIGTVPGILSHSLEEVNSLLGCANPKTTPHYLGVRMPGLMLPECPLKEKPSYLGAVFTTTPGLTGVALVILLIAIGLTSRERARKQSFERFQLIHNVSLPLWLGLLFIHGSNGWVGVGFPLVVFVCSVPVLLYSQDRILRTIRYYLFTGRYVNILDVIIRPGPQGKAQGSLINLMLSKPPLLWHHRDGMYGFLCMPEYSKFQWHPFTICSGSQDPSVDFIISAVGDWTNELARKCLDAHAGKGALPRLALDGPYLSPTVTALDCEVLVAVGAGVGITPFLSLMSTIVAVLSRGERSRKRRLPLKEAHFFWLTRNADELLFGRKHFTRIMSIPELRGKVFLHLHTTQRPKDNDVAAFLFREAIRRQSRADRASFDEVVYNRPLAELLHGAQLPWCWANDASTDVLWASSLIEGPEGSDSDLCRHFCQNPAEGDSPGGNMGSLMTTAMSPRPSLDSEVHGLLPKGLDAYLPVAFGRPDFAKEIRAIGKARPNYNVNVYVCGNDALVDSLQKVCSDCERDAQQEEAKGQPGHAQKYLVHFERFG